MRERRDFVQIRLTDAGRAVAGAGESLRVVTGRMHYLFVGTAVVEVLRAGEWTELRKDHDGSGNPIFESAETAAADPAVNEVA